MRISWFDIGLMAMILLLVGMHEANAFVVYQAGETIGVESQTCDTYQLLGKTFAYSNYPNIAACNIATRFFCGFRWINNQQNVFSIRASNMTISDALGTGTAQYYGFHNITLVAGHSNRFRVESSNVGAGGGDVGINITLPNGTTHQVLYASTVGIIASYAQETRINITEYNSSHYLINFTRYHEDSTGLTTAQVANTLPKGDHVNFTTQAISAMGGTSARLYLIEYPNYNCTYEINPLEIGNLSYGITSSLTGFYMSSYNGTPITPTGISGSYIRSDFKTDVITNATFANTTAYYQAYLYYSTQLLQPKITYYPMIDAFADFYNVSTGAAYLMNNTAAYVYDNVSSSWYLCPPFSITTWQTPYVMSCYYVSSNTVSNLNMSMLYTMKNCYQNGDNYSWFITSPSSTTFAFQQVYNNTTVINSVSAGTTYSGSSQIQGFSNNAVTLNLTISANGNTICSYQNGTSVFGLGSIPMFSSYSITSIAGFIVFLLFVALTAVIPFAAIPAFFMNDIFAFVNQTEMFYIFAFAGVIGVMINYIGERSLKSLGMYIAIGVAILFHYATVGTAAGLAGMPDLTGINAQMATMQDAINTANLWSFSVSAIGLVISFGLFILFFPATISNFLFTSISYISPNLYTAVSVFIPIFTFGIYLWLALKLYEIISNRFRSI